MWGCVHYVLNKVLLTNSLADSLIDMGMSACVHCVTDYDLNELLLTNS